MKHKSVLLGVGVLALGVLLVAGGLAWREFYGGSATFDEQFYLNEAKQASPFSYEPYDSLLRNFVDERGMVYYAGLKRDRTDLDQFVRSLAAVKSETLQAWSREQKLAFWINAYNALTLKAIIDHYPIRPGRITRHVYPANSIRQIPGVWSKIQFLVAGRKLTLNQIEHEILRKQFSEPRIHVALVCAAMGCPRLRNKAYRPSRLDQQLVQDTRAFIANRKKVRIDREANVVHLSSIFKWFAEDFTVKYTPLEGFGQRSTSDKSVLNFIAGQIPAPEAIYLRDAQYDVKYLDYDWSLNERPEAISPAPRPATQEATSR